MRQVRTSDLKSKSPPLQKTQGWGAHFTLTSHPLQSHSTPNSKPLRLPRKSVLATDISIAYIFVVGARHCRALTGEPKVPVKIKKARMRFAPCLFYFR